MSNPLFIGIDLNGGYGTAMSLQLIVVGKRHCRLLYIPTIDSGRETALPCPLYPYN